MTFDHYLNYTALFLPSLLFLSFLSLPSLPSLPSFRYLIAFIEIESIDSDHVSFGLAAVGVLVADPQSLIPKVVFDFSPRRPHSLI